MSTCCWNRTSPTARPCQDSNLLGSDSACLPQEYLRLSREMVQRGLLPARLLAMDVMAEHLVASLLDGVRASHDQNPGHDLVLRDGRTVQVKARCRGTRGQPGKVEFRPDAAFDLLVVLDLERGGGEVRRAGMLVEPDAKSLATVVPDKQGRVNVPLQQFFRHPALHNLTTAARQYDVADLYLGVARRRDEQRPCTH